MGKTDKIIEGIKDALAGNISAVTVDGVRFVRDDSHGAAEARNSALREVITFFDKTEHLVWSSDEICDAVQDMLTRPLGRQQHG